MSEQEMVKVRIITNDGRRIIDVPVDTPLIKFFNDQKFNIMYGVTELNGSTICVSDLYKTFADFDPFKNPECMLIHIRKCGDCGDHWATEMLFPVFVGKKNNQNIHEATLVHARILTEVLDRIVNTIHKAASDLVCRCYKKDHSVIIEIKHPDDDDSKFSQIAEIGDFLRSFDEAVDLDVKRSLIWNFGIDIQRA